MNNEFSMRETIMEVFRSMGDSVADFVPRAVAAFIVILLGLLVAKLVEKAIRVGFDRFKLNDLLDRVGLSSTLQKFGMKDKPGKLISRAVYFLLVLLFTQSVTQAVGLATVAGAIAAFFAYLPNLISAFLVLVLGMMVAQFLGRTLTQAAEDSGVEFAPLLGRIVSSLVLFVVVLMAVSQLKIDTQIVLGIVLVILAGMSLAFALTFGLGSREVTRNIVAGFYVRKLFQVGEPVEVGDVKGTLAGITAVQTLVESGENTLALPNRVFMDEVVKQ
jgi:small-conductance mechanosensitive channel